MQSGHRATEAAGKFGIAVKLLDVPDNFRRKEIIPRQIHLVTGPKQDMIHPTFAAVTEFESDFIADRIGLRYRASNCDLYG